jgi:hypothetical protein
MPEAVIVDCLRTPVGKAPKGALRETRPDDLAAAVLRELAARHQPGPVDDVILGCAMPEGEQGMNIARIAALLAGLPVSTPAMTINRFCASGLQAIALAADRSAPVPRSAFWPAVRSRCRWSRWQATNSRRIRGWWMSGRKSISQWV